MGCPFGRDAVTVLKLHDAAVINGATFASEILPPFPPPETAMKITAAAIATMPVPATP